jgi:hypothetical protein
MALGIVVLVGYVASYPVILRITMNPDIIAYRPVQFLIDETPVADPICRCSEIFGFERYVRLASTYRKIRRDLQLP